MRWLLGMLAGLLLAFPAIAAPSPALKARLAASAAAMADPDSIEPSRQVDLARAHLALCVEAWGATAPETAACEMELGRALLVEDFPVDARPALERAVAGLTGEPQARARSLLGEALTRTGEFAAAEEALAAAIAVQKNAAQRAITLRRQAEQLTATGRFGEAEKALATARASAAVQAPSIHEQALLLLAAGRLAFETDKNAPATERLLPDALAMMEAKFGPNDSRLGLVLEQLATRLRREKGELAAEPVSERALAIERTRSRQNPQRLGSALNDLAIMLGNTGRLAQAIALQRQAVTLAEVHGPPLSLAIRTVNLGGQLLTLKSFAEAVEVLRLAVVRVEGVFGPDHANVTYALNPLSEALAQLGRYDEGVATARRVLALREAAFGPEHESTIFARNYLGSQLIRGAPAEAVTVLRTAVAGAERRFGDDHGDTLTTRAVLANALQASGDVAGAIAEVDRILESLRKPRQGESVLSSGIADLKVTMYNSLLNRLAFQLAGPGARAPGAMERLFAVLQLDDFYTGSGRISWRSAARLAATDPDIRQLADEQREGQARLTLLRRDVSVAPDPKQRAEEIAVVEARLKTVERDLATRNPGYAAQAARMELPLAGLTDPHSRLLGRGEALLVLRQSQIDLMAMIVRSSVASAFYVPNARNDEVAGMVTRVRKGIDLDKALTADDLPQYDLAAAHDLYRRIITPLLPHLKGVHTLHVVAEGPIARLPLALIVEKPGAGRTAEERYRRTRWLGDRFAIVSHAGISAFAAGRSVAAPSRAEQPVLAVADPALAGTKQVAGLSSFAKLRGDVRSGLIATRNAAAICAMQPLPDTRREAERLAKTLNGGAGALILGEAATERRVRSMGDSGELAKYRTLLFATHGLAGVADSGEEPALILKPASCTATADEDDGLLSASEIATLKLDADLVILSGCNTAAPGDALAGEPFSGLAQAFRHAGARRLLVSHWSVDSAATADLMGSVFAAKGPLTPQRLQRAMRDMRNSRGALSYRAHPAFWAPFVLVGDSR